MNESTTEEMKQKVSLMILKYYQQLQNGCDNFSCKNEFCRSCANFLYANITDPNELGAKSIMLVSNYGDRYLCQIEPIECSKFRIGKIRKYVDWGGDGVYQLEELVEQDLGTDRLDSAFHPGSDLQKAIEPSIINQISILEKTAKTTTSFQYLRRIAILICFHAFSKKEFSKTLYRLIKLYHLLNKQAKEILNTWFEKSIPSSILTKIVTFLNIFISNEIPQTREIYLPPSQTIIDASTLLGDIFVASKNDLKKKLKVVFEGEDGVDEGGVKKEFFQLVVQQIFDPKYGMFVENEEMNKTNFWFNKSYIGEMGSYRLIGTILGLAIYNSVILDVRFPSVVYKKLLNRPLVLEDLHDYRPEIERGMWQLLAYEDSVEEIYMRTFQISYKTVFGEEIFVNLKKNGNKIPLTNENREEYVKLFVEWELNKSIEKQFLAFRNGFESLIEPEELEALICGDHEFEMKDLKKSAKYRDGYNSGSIQMKWLWNIIFSWTKEKQKKFLAFCFGTDRVPIGGLSNLRFTITRGGPDSEILPKASTCYGILILPAYSTKEKLKKKIELAIENSQGFGLF
ncbi:hypothetical protein M0812_01990 [Anaeramoeba flamelloides]|uniref:HECT-type E3 ubiquitin transferase n=1 Tax=Anaeramoeba flamelloides TaxID=1746091 RepID=A0AAV7YYG7_9EUKA|nr:hypothetical protein M0812_01990 [Anaeramoeba flamelloides]